MKLLAIDTSTEACSAALWWDGEIYERYTLAPREHAGLILGMIDGLLGEAGIKVSALGGLAYARGPGTFTGLRIAAAVLQGIALAADLPVAPVSTLATLAQGAYRMHGATCILSALDARMGEVYWGTYELGAGTLMQRIGEEILCTPDLAPLPDCGNWYGAGNGFAVYAETLRRHAGPIMVGCNAQCYPHAADVATLGAAALAMGQVVSAEAALPVYLRDQVTG